MLGFTARWLAPLVMVAAVLAPGIAQAAVPANDDFANAQALTLPGNATVDTTDATVEASEFDPNLAAANTGSVWYTVTPASDGLLTVTTQGSAFDTILSIGTATAASNLTTIPTRGLNFDDSNPNDDASSAMPILTHSKVTVVVRAGVKVYLQVVGSGTASGALNITATLATLGATGGGNDYAGEVGDVFVDADGNQYVVGTISTPGDLDDGPAEQVHVPDGSDAYVIKTDGSGATIWIALIRGNGNETATAVKVSGTRVYVAGTSSSSNFKVSNGAATLSSRSIDGFVAALSTVDGTAIAGFGTAGGVLIGSASPFDTIEALAVAPDGLTVYAGGRADGMALRIGGTGGFNTPAYGTAFIAALNADGTPKASFDGDGIQVFGGVNLPALVAFDPAQVYFANLGNCVRGLAIAPDGQSIYATGVFNSQNSGIGGTGTVTANGLSDAFILALTPTGAAKAGFGNSGVQIFGGTDVFTFGPAPFSQYVGDGGYDIAVSADGAAIYVTGFYEGLDAGLGGPGGVTVFQPQSNSDTTADLFLLGLNAATGNALTAFGVGDPGNDAPGVLTRGSFSNDASPHPQVEFGMYEGKPAVYWLNVLNGTSTNVPGRTVRTLLEIFTADTGVRQIDFRGFVNQTVPVSGMSVNASGVVRVAFPFINSAPFESSVAGVTFTKTPAALVKDSAATATPNPATTGQDVAFSIGVTDPDGLALSAAWTFGDGTTGTGLSVTHAYAAKGSYTASVTVNGTSNRKITDSVTVVVNDPVDPLDTDGDGFLNTVEQSAGTDPNDAADAPDAVFAGTTTTTFTATSLKLSLKPLDADADSIALTGTLPLTAGQALSLKNATISIAGATRTLLPKKEISVKGNIKTPGVATFKIAVKELSLGGGLARIGFDTTTAGTKTLPVLLFVNNMLYSANVNVAYKPSKSGGGAGSLPKAAKASRR